MEGLAYGTPAARGVLAAAILGSGVAFVDATIVNVVLPVLGRELGAGLAGLQWTLDAYLLTLTAFLLPGGALGDRLGRRRVYVVGLVAFGVASALCGLAPTAATLVAARAIQGLAAALLVPGSLSLLRACFRESDAPRAVGAWAALSGVTTAVGPLAGGWLASAVSWRAIFLLNLPLVALAAWAAIRFVPESRDPSRARPDLAGGALAAAGLATTVYALIEAPSCGAATVPAAIVGLLLLAAFVVVERRLEHPMLPPALFRSRAFTGVNATTLAVYFGLGGSMFLLALQLQRGLGWSPLASGAALMPVTVLMLLLSSTAGRLSGRVGPRPFLVAGPLLVAAGLLLLGRVAPGTTWAAGILPGAVALGLGLATTVAPLTSAALAAVPAAQSGVASGVNNAVARLAGLLAVAVLPAVAGLSADDLARGDLTAGYARAMSIGAATAVIGALVAWAALPGRARGAPLPHASRAGSRA